MSEVLHWKISYLTKIQNASWTLKKAGCDRQIKK